MSVCMDGRMDGVADFEQVPAPPSSTYLHLSPSQHPVRVPHGWPAKPQSILPLPDRCVQAEVPDNVIDPTKSTASNIRRNTVHLQCSEGAP